MGEKIYVTSVHMEVVDHDHGHWCNGCQLATGLRIWVSVRHGDRMHLQTRLGCTECGGHHITEVPVDDADHC